MKKISFCLFTLLSLSVPLTGLSQAQTWKMRPLATPTRWAKEVRPTKALPDYPRPQLVRHDWQNLNGLWQYTITDERTVKPEHYDGNILVPYPVESALSGVAKPLKSHERLWYRRRFTLPASEGKRTLLHFGAVDYRATVYLNGAMIGSHEGGYQSFTLDITRSARTGDNELLVKVYDPTEDGPNPHGKQGMQYTASSGIWQTVWIETVPLTFIESLRLTPDVDHSQLRIEAQLRGEQEGYTLEAVAKAGATVVARQPVNGPTALTIRTPHLWSPQDPFLYDLEIRLLKNGQAVDDVDSYFGMRKVEIKKDAHGFERIFLNNRYTYNLGVLDQGFWPDGLYTAPTDAALRFDIETLKAMGFNTIRKHIKIEPERWYYYCDRLGMLVWQDMVNPANTKPASKAQFEREVQENLTQLHEHPSIITWVLFNEGWGSYDQPRLAAWIKQLDPTRLLNAHSGPYDQERADKWIKALPPDQREKFEKGGANGELLEKFQHDTRVMEWPGSDMADVHHYPGPELPPKAPGKALILGEFGGLGVVVKGHIWKPHEPGSGYRDMPLTELPKAYEELMDSVKKLEAQGLAGSIYTQVSDVEQEQNGLMTYDRAVIKIPVEKIAGINKPLVAGP